MSKRLISIFAVILLLPPIFVNTQSTYLKGTQEINDLLQKLEGTAKKADKALLVNKAIKGYISEFQYSKADSLYNVNETLWNQPTDTSTNSTSIQQNIEKIIKQNLELLEAQQQVNKEIQRRYWLFCVLILLVLGFGIYVRRNHSYQIKQHHKKLETIRLQVNNYKQTIEELNLLKANNQNELTSHIIRYLHIKQQVEEINTTLKHFVKGDSIDSSGKVIDKLQRQMDALTINEEEDWNNFMVQFVKLNPTFLDQLKEKGITSKMNVKNAICLRMGMNYKDSAALLKTTTSAIKQSRHRIKKRLELEKSVDLAHFLQQL